MSLLIPYSLSASALSAIFGLTEALSHFSPIKCPGIVVHWEQEVNYEDRWRDQKGQITDPELGNEPAISKDLLQDEHDDVSVQVL